MATSGTYAFSFDIVQTIEEAFERARVDLTTLSGRQLRSARTSLDLLFRNWENRQINLWCVEDVSLTLTQGDLDITTATGTIDILDTYLRRDGKDVEITRISRDEYALLPDKDEQGRPSQMFVERERNQVVINLWQAPENSTDVLHYWRIREIQDTGNFTNDPDVPGRFWDAMAADLAHRLAVKDKSVSRDWVRELKGDRDEALELAIGEDRERVSTFVTPAGYAMEGW